MIDTFLFLFLAVCAFTDLKTKKVYNALVSSAVIIGFGLNYYYGGLAGLGHSALGLAAGFLFLLPFYVLGGVGAGDVKFMAAVGCLKGAKFVLMGGLYGAVLGGIAAIAVLVYEKRFVSAVKKIYTSLLLLVTFRVPEAMKLDTERKTYLPYTVFLSFGMLLWWFETSFFR